MIRPDIDVQAYLYRQPVDMRKSINGLSVLVEQELDLSPMMPALFVFCNRKHDKIKLLHWERNGFVLWYKRLEKQRFKWLKPSEKDMLTISGQQLNDLLDGIDIFYNKPHKTLFYDSIT